MLAGLSACGYIGEPLPPSLKIPAPATDLVAVQRGSKIIVTATLPGTTNDGVKLKEIPQAEIWVGPVAHVPLNVAAQDVWQSTAAVVAKSAADGERLRVEFDLSKLVNHPIDQDVQIAVKLRGENGKDAGFSLTAVLPVVTPLESPQLHAESDPRGVRLTWQSNASEARIFRKGDTAKAFVEIGIGKAGVYVDESAAYLKPYVYIAQGIQEVHAKTPAAIPQGNLKAVDVAYAESDRSNEVSITAEDTFPPSVPAGLAAIVGSASVELTWSPVPETDLTGYRIYRATGGNSFERIGETQGAPTFSDRKITSGRTYRYAVSSFDHIPNESKTSESVEVSVP